MFLRVETGTGQIAVIYRNGHPWTFVAPERRALFWKGVVRVKAELDRRRDGPRRAAPASRSRASRQRRARRSSAFDAAILVREVPEAHVGLLFVDGQLVRELPPGVHAFWKIGRNVRVRARRLARQSARGRRARAAHEGQGEPARALERELPLSRRAAHGAHDRDPVDFVYKEIQLGLRSAVAKRSLGALLEHKGSLDRDVFARVHDKLAALGIDLTEIGVNELARITL